MMFLSVGVSFGSSLVKSVSKFPTSVLDRCEEQNITKHALTGKHNSSVLTREEPSGPFPDLSIPCPIEGLNPGGGGAGGKG